MDSGVSQAIHLLKQENNLLKDQVSTLTDENQRLQAYVKAISALQEATLTIANQNNLMQLLDEILYQALVIINTDHGSILLTDEENQELVFVLVHGKLRESLEGYRLAWDEGIAGAAVQTQQPQIVNQTRQDPRFHRGVDQTFGIQSDQILAVPMLHQQKVIGVIELVNKRNGQPFSESDVALLSLLGVFSAMSLEQMNQRFKLEEIQPVG